MIFSQLSDLSASIGMRSLQARVKTELDIAGQRVASGKKANLVRATNGRLGHLFRIDQTLQSLETEATALKAAGAKTQVMQIGLDSVRKALSGYGPRLLAAVNRGDKVLATRLGAQAQNKLETVVGALNEKFGNQHLFSGAATDTPAIAPAATIVSDIAGIISSSASASAALTAIDSYFFDSGAGFETTIYKGAVQDSTPVVMQNGTKIDFGIRADSREVRTALRSLAITAAVSSISTLSGTPDETLLLQNASRSLVSADANIVSLQASLGFSEENITNAAVTNAAQVTALTMIKGDITSADPYVAATRFQALQGQIQSMYIVTARLAGLSLTNYLR